VARLQHITAGLLAATTTGEVAGAFTTSLTAGPGPVGWCQVWLADDQLRLAAASESAPTPTAAAVALDGPSVLARCARSHTPVFATGQARDPSCPSPEASSADPVVSAGLLPILVDDQCRGVVVAAYVDAAELDDREREFMVAVAGHLAHALERSELYGEQAAIAQASAFLAESAQIVAEATGFADTLDRLAVLALTALGDICLIDVVSEDGSLERMVARHRDEAIQPLVDRLSEQYPPDPGGLHPVVDVVATGRTSWSPEMSDAFLRDTTRDDEHFRLVKSLDFRSYLAVPLRTGGEMLGSMTLVSSRRPFGPGDVSFAERLALQVAAVLNNARRYDASQQTSHILQRSLLPKRLPQVAGLELETRYLPATRGLEVGGDCYDLLALPSGRVGFMIADVAGHDRDAAAAMGQLRSAARALAGQVPGPSELIAALQWSWDLLGMERMATALFGRLDQSRGDLVMASAGHHPPLLIGEGEARYLAVVPSTPLGAPETPAVNWEGHLEPGQVLLLYTDGLLDGRGGGPESESADDMARLAAVAADGPATPSEVCGRLLAMLPHHRPDDVALLALRIIPS
jgi:serine/threonine-protein kinase RsbW